MERCVVILSASSDIGRALMDRYLKIGATVVGSYRQDGALDSYRDQAGVHTVQIDLDRSDDFCALADYLRDCGLEWDLFIAANGTMEPIGPFLELEGAHWKNSIITNAMAPLMVLQSLYQMRRRGRVNDVCFFAGGGTNGPFRNYSAYCLSKILLIKMCELLDDEAPDLKTFILGPGYVRTKIHEETLRAALRAGDNLEKTLRFLEGDGTSMDDIHACVEWCVAQDRAVVGGRNFSVVHDPWRNGGVSLARELAADTDLYKLRRAGNNRFSGQKPNFRGDTSI